MKYLILIILITSTFTVSPVFAGSAQKTEITLPVKLVEEFAKAVEVYAANEGARAFIISRVGRPEKDLPKGIKFTHTAIAVYSTITLESGEQVNGYAIHNLYQKTGQLNKSELVVDYPIDFFWGVNNLKAGIIIPTPALQSRIIDVIASGKDKQIHNENYSVIANPFNDIFQNCTEHTLNVVNASVYQTTDINQLKVTATEHFKPQKVKASPFKLMLGNWFVDDVSTKDHDGKIYTTTFSSIGRYLQNNDLLTKAVILYPDGVEAQLL